MHDTTLVTNDAPLLRVVAQKARVEPGVEMIGIRELRHIARHGRERRQETSLRRCDGRRRIVIERMRMAMRFQSQPELMKRNAIDVRAELAELMKVSMARMAPVPELNAQL